MLAWGTDSFRCECSVSRRYLGVRRVVPGAVPAPPEWWGTEEASDGGGLVGGVLWPGGVTAWRAGVEQLPLVFGFGVNATALFKGGC
jgi:hypothetical protein